MRRELGEPAAVFLAGGSAHLLVITLGHREHGVVALLVLGATLIVGTFGVRWWRHGRAVASAAEESAVRVSGGAVASSPAAGTSDGGPGAGAGRPAGDGLLWRIRVEVDDVPGGLATLTAHLAGLGVDIRLVQVLPGDTDAVDEFLATSPAHVREADLRAAVDRAGGRDVVVVPADVHELSDTTSRTLALVTALVTDDCPVEDVLAGMSGARVARRRAAPPPGRAPDDVRGDVMCLSAPGGGVVVLERDGVPFAPVEFARCRALVVVAALLDEHAAR